MSKLCVGIIGLGRAGWAIHLVGLANHAHFRVTAVADTAPERVAEAKELTGCRGYSDYRSLLADPAVDLVVVATPSNSHAAIACEALRAGKHVVVEKPLAVTLEEADMVIDVARETGKALTVYQNRRLDPDFLFVKRWLESGKLGKVSLVRMGRYQYNRRSDWQTLRKYGGGMLGNWGAHMLDWALQLAPDAELAFADLKQTVSAGDAEDHVKVVLRTRSGMVLDLEIAYGCAVPVPEWVVIGQYGSVLSDGQTITARWCDPTRLPPLVAEEGPAAGRRYASGELIEWMTESVPVGNHLRPGAEPWYDNLFEVLTGGGPLQGAPETVRRQIQLIHEVRTFSNTSLEI